MADHDDQARAVHRLFEAQVRRTPTAVALAEPGGSELTYAELNEQANRLARELRAHGVRRGDLVGLRMPRSTAAVTSMLAILKAGAAYLPLEDRQPGERLRRMVAETRPRLVLTDQPSDRPGWLAPKIALLCLAEAATAIAGRPTSDLDVPAGGDDAMYVIYTSGSTGRPKGAVVPHRSLPGYFVGTGDALWCADEVCLWHLAMSWDGHAGDIYPALLNGAKLIVFPATFPDPIAVAELARATGVTLLVLTTAAFNAVISTDPSPLAGLRTLLVAGEALSRTHARRALEALPGVRLLNVYGPTECGVVTSCHVVRPTDPQRSSIPIGRPAGDRCVYVLDDHGNQVPAGQPGELYVGGPAVAQGYLGRPRLSAESFVPDPFGGRAGARLYRTGDRVRRDPEGTLEFLGRVDGQVKVRGFRVETGEVEAALRELPGVRDAVVAIDPGSGEVRLVGYLMVDGPVLPTVAELRGRLAKLLPDHMIPSAFRWIEHVPLNSSGKVDRERLPASVTREIPDTATYVAPRTDLESRIAVIWQRVLGIERVGLEDSFFDVGGHSLQVVRVRHALRGLGVDVEMVELFAYPTIRALAAHLEKRDDAQVVPPAGTSTSDRRTAGRARLAARRSIRSSNGETDGE